jgi:hypothetical protein
MTKLVLKTEAADAMRILSVEEISLISGARKLEAEATAAAEKANNSGKLSK